MTCVTLTLLHATPTTALRICLHKAGGGGEEGVGCWMGQRMGEYGTEEHVTSHTSHVTRHTSHVTRYTLHVTRHLRCRPKLETTCDYTHTMIAQLPDKQVRVWGLGFGVWGLGFGVWGLGFGVWGFGFRVQCLRRASVMLSSA